MFRVTRKMESYNRVNSPFSADNVFRVQYMYIRVYNASACASAKNSSRPEFEPSFPSICSKCVPRNDKNFLAWYARRRGATRPVGSGRRRRRRPRRARLNPPPCIYTRWEFRHVPPSWEIIGVHCKEAPVRDLCELWHSKTEGIAASSLNRARRLTCTLSFLRGRNINFQSRRDITVY